MFKTFLYSMFAVFLFALGAVGSWYFINSQADAEQTAEMEDLTANDSPLPSIPEIASAIPTVSLEPEVKEDPLPTVIPAKPTSAEDIFRFGVINRNRMEKLQERENALDERERQMMLEAKDLEARQAEVDGLMAHVNDTIVQAESLLSSINKKRLELAEDKKSFDEQKEQFESETGLTPADQEKNEKQAAGLIQSMNPDTAANVIRELANDGKMDYALALLEKMEQRNGAKILEAINDKTLIAEITDKLRARKRLNVSAKAPQQR
jgi:hypothetical protein